MAKKKALSICYFVGLSLICSFLFGQDMQRIDSLRDALPVSQKMERMSILLELAAAWQYADPDLARRYGEDALREAKNLYKQDPTERHLDAQADAHKRIAVSYSIQGKNNQALDQANLALDIYKRFGNAADLTEIYNALGIVYDQMGEMDQALIHYGLAEKACLEWGNVDRLSGIYNNIGFVYQSKSEYTRALTFYKRSLNLAEQIESDEGIGYAYYNMAVIHDYLGEFEESLRLFYLSLQLREALNNQFDVASSLNGIAVMHNKLGDIDKSLEYHERSLAIKKDLGLVIGQAHSYNNIGNIFSKKQQYAEAQSYHEKALQLQQQVDDKSGMSKSYQLLAEVLQRQQQTSASLSNYRKSLNLKKKLEDQYGEAKLILGLASLQADQGNLSQAISLLKRGLNISQQIGAREVAKSTHLQLAEVYRESGNYAKALTHQRAYSVLQDSLFQLSLSKQIAEMNTKYETEKKEQTILAQNGEIALLEQKQINSRNLRNAFMVIGAMLLLTAAVIYNRYRMKQRSERMLQAKNQEIEQKNQEIKVINGELEKRMLRAQMDPHFVFNSLNSIQHFITINDKDSALKYLSKFSKLIREVLENSVNQYVPIEDEIKLLENYMQLEALRLDHKFDFSVHVDPKLDTYDVEIPFLLIQPYVENAIVHGLRHRTSKGHLQVDLQKNGQYVHCTVQDNGVGRKRSREIEKKKRKYTSHGMPITAQRLELLNKGQERKTTVAVKDLYDKSGEPIGTRVDIDIPLETT